MLTRFTQPIDDSVYAILAVDFEDFKKKGEFLRYPQDAHLTIKISETDPSSSFNILISHCWLRGNSESEGWNGAPHPDNASQDKYKLCVEGIQRMRQVLCPDIAKCLIWMDFACINQEGNPAMELEHLDKIVQWADCLFTPIVDKDHMSWEMPSNLTPVLGYYADYKSTGWNLGPKGYLNRSWCRLEMMYAANIPPLYETPAKLDMFTAGLKFARQRGRRLHVLYGTKESETMTAPIALPPLQNSYFEAFQPLDGYYSYPKDAIKLEQLMGELRPYIKHMNEFYEGTRNEQGLKEGYGKLIVSSGDEYQGDFKNDLFHGFGILMYCDADIYMGEFKEGDRNGFGKYIWADGGQYIGDWLDRKMHGLGKAVYPNGDVSVGMWEYDKRIEGETEYIFKNPSPDAAKRNFCMHW